WLNGAYLKVLKELSAELNLPLVDWSDMLARASQNQVAGRERHLGVARSSAISVPDEDHLMDVVFRVSQGAQRMYISGSPPSLNSFQPNTLSMYDDGTHGDEVAGDKIWSLRARLRKKWYPVSSATSLNQTSGQHGRGALLVTGVHVVNLDQ